MGEKLGLLLFSALSLSCYVNIVSLQGSVVWSLGVAGDLRCGMGISHS